jgi:hypothetical protein
MGKSRVLSGIQKEISEQPAPNLVMALWTSCTQLIPKKIKVRVFV